MWHRPSLPGRISTNAPKSLTLVTRPCRSGRPGPCGQGFDPGQGGLGRTSASALAMVTVPSSSTSIMAPVVFLNAADRLAARADQQADLVRVDLRAQQPRGRSARCRLAAAEWPSASSAGSRSGPRGLGQRGADDLLADAVDLQVELDAGDAVLRAGDLEVHVAEVVFVADDVGQQRPTCRLPSPGRPRCRPPDW